jgi:DNA-directed RNA polymerase specialized sigma24 family protein
MSAPLKSVLALLLGQHVWNFIVSILLQGEGVDDVCKGVKPVRNVSYTHEDVVPIVTCLRDPGSLVLFMTRTGTHLPDDFEERKKSFDQRFAELYRSKIFIARIKTLLGQYRNTLGDGFEVDDILVEIYERGLAATLRGIEIENLEAWSRGTSVNIMRELHRDKQRSDKLVKKLQPESRTIAETSAIACDPADQAFVIERLARFEQLNSVDQRILLLDAMGKTYRVIATQVFEEHLCQKLLSENAIAQRIRRARMRLNSGETHGDGS